MLSVPAHRVNGRKPSEIMGPKPELLFLSHRLPTPPHNGAAIRTFNTIRGLSESYRVTALCFDRLVHAGNDTTRNTLSGTMRLLTEFPDQKARLAADPSLMGGAVKVHPLVVIFALLAAGELFGLAGVLLAMPLVAIGREVSAFLLERIGLESWRDMCLQRI